MLVWRKQQLWEQLMQATIGFGGRGWEGLWLGACPGSLLFKRSRRLAARQAGLEGGLQREALRFSR